MTGPVGVLVCSKSKLARAARAVELYTGRTFRAALALLRALGCVRFVVLSAEHGALEGDAVVAPYDRSLYQLGAAERRAWAARAAVELRALLAGAEVLAVVPNAYAGALEGVAGVRLFPGLPQGELYSALAGALGLVRDQVEGLGVELVERDQVEGLGVELVERDQVEAVEGDTSGARAGPGPPR